MPKGRPGSSDDIATGYVLEFRGSIPSGCEIFRTCPDRPWGPPNLLYNGYRVFTGNKERPGRDADPSPLSSAVIKIKYSYTSTPPMGRTACTVHLYLYSPIDRTACTEPQCLYSTAILLLPLLAVQPVQNLSACRVQLYLYSPYWPYGLYGASVPVQGCTLPLPLPRIHAKEID